MTLRIRLIASRHCSALVVPVVLTAAASNGSVAAVLLMLVVAGAVAGFANSGTT
jgi:hypothetical protein